MTKINTTTEIKTHNIMYANIKIHERICLGTIWIEIETKDRSRWSCVGIFKVIQCSQYKARTETNIRRTTIAWLYFQRDLEIHFRTSCLYQWEKQWGSSKKVIICSLLIALMKNQCERLSLIPGVKAVYLGERKYLFIV